MLSPPGAPDKRRLMTVQDFFKYAEDEGAPQTLNPDDIET